MQMSRLEHDINECKLSSVISDFFLHAKSSKLFCARFLNLWFLSSPPPNSLVSNFYRGKAQRNPALLNEFLWHQFSDIVCHFHMLRHHQKFKFRCLGGEFLTTQENIKLSILMMLPSRLLLRKRQIECRCKWKMIIFRMFSMQSPARQLWFCLIDIIPRERLWVWWASGNGVFIDFFVCRGLVIDGEKKTTNDTFLMVSISKFIASSSVKRRRRQTLHDRGFWIRVIEIVINSEVSTNTFKLSNRETFNPREKKGSVEKLLMRLRKNKRKLFSSLSHFPNTKQRKIPSAKLCLEKRLIKNPCSFPSRQRRREEKSWRWQPREVKLWGCRKVENILKHFGFHLIEFPLLSS